MGLLDEAIRDHLELKRKRGADEPEIKRLADEAFGPPERPDEVGVAEPPPEGEGAPEALAGNGEPRPPEESAADDLFEDTMPHDMEAELGLPAEGEEPSEPGPEEGSLDLEDIELELDEEELLGGDETPPEGDPDAEVELGEASPEESEAEIEGDQAPEEPAGKEGESPGDSEDVLEDTPEFLEDTPESERLWFEQRPPKDFDFEDDD